jgi:hypothetical protein
VLQEQAGCPAVGALVHASDPDSELTYCQSLTTYTFVQHMGAGVHACIDHMTQIERAWVYVPVVVASFIIGVALGVTILRPMGYRSDWWHHGSGCSHALASVAKLPGTSCAVSREFAWRSVCTSNFKTPRCLTLLLHQSTCINCYDRKAD